MGAGGRVETTLIFFTFLSLLACNSKRDIRAYYYPVETFRDGRVYAYASEAGDTSEQRYWYFNAFPTDSGLFVAGTQYDRNFQIVQLLREKIVHNGSLARNSFLYETDSTGKALTMAANIESPNLFPFQVTDSLGVFLFGLSYHPGGDTATTIYIIRNRRYLGDGPDFDWKGRKYPTVRFGLQEAVGNRQEGSSEVEGSGEEWYAKGLGLVYYQKSFSEGKVRFAYRLRDTFSMAELERRARQPLGGQ